MIKYKLKKDSIKPFSFSYLKDYLEALGIKQTDSFIKQPRLEDQESWQMYDNIIDACIAADQAAKLAKMGED